MSELPLGQPNQQVPAQREISERPSWMLDNIEDTPGYGVDGWEAYADVADRLQKGRVAVTPVVEVEIVAEPEEVPTTMSGQIDIRNSGADWHVDPEATVEVKPDPGVNNALPNQDDSVHWYNNRLPAQTTTPPNLPSLKN